MTVGDEYVLIRYLVRCVYNTGDRKSKRWD